MTHPHVTTTSRGRLVALTLAGLLAMATLPSTAPAQDTCDAEGEFACAADTFEPDPPLLDWLEVASPSASTTGTTMTLRFENTRDEAVDVNVTIVADGGNSRRKSRRVVWEDVAPGRVETYSLDLAALRFARRGMPFAGQILASARIKSASLCAGGGCRPARDSDALAPDTDAPGARTATVPTERAAEREPVGAGPIFVVSPPAYFHPGAAPDSFEIYGSEVLTSRFAAGDLNGTSTAVPEVHILRVSDGGKARRHKNKYLAEMDALTYDDDNASGAPHTPQGPINISANLLGICVKWEIQTVDHGKKIITEGGLEITEDIWNGQTKSKLSGFKLAGAGGDGRMAVTARGAVVLVQRGDWSEYLETNPKTGCVSFAGQGPGTYEITVYTMHLDSRGNAVVYVGEDDFPFGFKEIVALKTAKPATISVGDFTGESTLAAISGFAMYRTTFGVTNKRIYIENVNTCGKDEDDNPNSDGGANSSAHYDTSGLPSAAYVRIHDGSREGCSTSDHRRYKFIVTHEMGHAWQILNQGKTEPDPSTALDDPDETVCINDGAYTLGTLEHSVIGAREGMAHFYATVIWNSPASAEAVFTWFGFPEDPESADDGAIGGRLFNVCDTPNKCGKTTIIDWLRHYWDWHTPWLPGSKPNPADTTRAYGDAVNDEDTFRSNYYQQLDDATDAIPALVAYKTSWDHFAELNGVGTWPANASCDLPDYPGCDASNPYDTPGQLGCPCADVEPTLNELFYGNDRFYPDGTGSFLFHGPGGTGQYCEDSTTAAAAEAVCNQRGSDGAPECMSCGSDTMLACACTTDSECQALGDSTLECWGGQDQGWPGTAVGRCMPNANSAQGKSALEDSPWICLESCTSRGGGDPDRFACMYDQRDPDVAMTHAQCVDVVGCTAMAGWCEQSGGLCDTEVLCNGDPDDCCVAECTEDEHCAALGFPASYVCDGLGFAGFCVPAGCEFPEADQEFCDMFR